MGTMKKARIAYTGTALDSGSMPVKDLAPALLAFAELVENSYSVIGGEHKIQVLLNQDSINTGSFDVTFLLNLDFIEQVKLFVSNSKENGLDDLMTVLGWVNNVIGLSTFAVGGVFGLIKTVKGRRIKNITQLPDNKSELTLIDDKKIVTDDLTLRVFLDHKCRMNIEKIIQPLERNGVSGFQLRNPQNRKDSTPIVNIPENTVRYFKAPPPKDNESIETVTQKQQITVRIVSINFDDGKWRLSDGTNPFWATITDTEFLDKVANGTLSFSKGDRMKIEYYMNQIEKSGKLTTDYIVTRVIELKKAPTQIDLNFTPGNDNETKS